MRLAYGSNGYNSEGMSIRGYTFREEREYNRKKIVKHVNVGFEEVVHQIEVMEFRALCVINYVLPAVSGHIVLARSL